MATAVDLYDDNAETVVAIYEKASFGAVHGWLVDLLPSCPAAVLDVGAGSGRDAAWLAANGYDVVAVEPSKSMRAAAARLHPEASVDWIDDRLPNLGVVSRTGLYFDVVLLSAVWMHIPVHERPWAFDTLIALLKPGGILAVTFRDRPAAREWHIHPVSLDEIETLARDRGAVFERNIEARFRIGSGRGSLDPIGDSIAWRRRIRLGRPCNRNGSLLRDSRIEAIWPVFGHSKGQDALRNAAPLEIADQ